ncbi:unnamed protein product [Phytomonas sp. Hart1]|nr:unnamed protein product [Phytomonas sp. Hart1]|eukprot:CCW67866.1 unnamed protein product [Phytomonas sp. isolate Hart1]
MSISDKSLLSRKIVSADGPKQDEIDHNLLLEELCAACIEPEEESNRRRSVLERIHNIVRVWIRILMITEFRMPEAAAAEVEGRIFATGSYRYNVHTSGSDIDMVLIAPNRITREHFFDTLAPRFKNERWVTELRCIRDARVPIIAMVCDGIDIDLSFGCIRQDRVPEVITDDLLQGLDEQSVLSCNAVRVAHNIMDLVPNKAVFRQTLRFVKAWGKSRLIYSNTFGFPSGIGWAILTAFVCQCYPKQNAAGMVSRFFRAYHTWFKPNPHEIGTGNRAIYLTASMRGKTHLGRCWDPRESNSDAMALFPVLTPALPYGNACYNVTLTNLRQLCAEFKRGYEIVSSSLSMSPGEAKSTFGTYGVWSKLLEPAKFFGQYKHYLHVQVSCSNAELYQAYVDGVESRMRILWAGNASSRGHTLEDYKQLRLYLNPRRYEDPELVLLRQRLCKKMSSSTTRNTTPSTAAAQRPSSGSTGGKESQDSTGNHLSTLFTAHYFIGMTVETSVVSTKIDLAPSILTFHTVVKQLKQYSEGVTRLPVIKAIDFPHIPEFVRRDEGLLEQQTPEDAAAGGAPVTTGSNGPSLGGLAAERRSEPPALPQGEPSPVKPLNGSGTGGGDHPTADREGGLLGGETPTTEAGPPLPLSRAPTLPSIGNVPRKRLRGADDGNDDLEQALGLDF